MSSVRANSGHGQRGASLSRRLLDVERANRSFAVLSAVNHLLLHATHEQELLAGVCRIIVQISGYPLVWIGYPEQGADTAVRLVASARRGSACLPRHHQANADADVRCPATLALAQREAIIITNIEKAGQGGPWCEEVRACGYRAVIVQPLIADDTVLGVLVIYADEPAILRDDETQRLRELADNLAFGIRMLRLRGAHMHAAGEANLYRDRLETMMKAIPIPVFAKDRDGRYLFVNQAFLDFNDVAEADIIGKTVDAYWPTENARYYHAQDMALMAEDGERSDEMDFQLVAGGARHVLFSESCLHDPSGVVIGLIGAFVDITERKRAEQALEESLRASAELLKYMPSGTFIYRWDGGEELHLVAANPAAEQQTGITQTQHQGWEFNQIWPGARAAGITDAFLSVMHTGATYISDQVMYADNRLQGIYRIHAFILPRDHLAVSFEDITAQVQAEEELRKREATMRAIFEAAKNVAFIITDADDPVPHVLEFSPGAERIFGYTREEMLGKSVAVLHEPDDVAHFPATHRIMAEGQRGFSGETMLVRKSGEHFPAMFTTYPLYDASGHMYGALGVSVDISDIKRTEASLRASEERYRLMVEGSKQIFFYQHDTAYRFTYLSPSVSQVLGYMPKELLGHPFTETLAPDELNQQVLTSTDAALRTGARRDAYTGRLARKGGEIITVEIIETPIIQGGQVVGLQGFVHDISARVQAEQALKMERALLLGAIDILPFPIVFIGMDSKPFLANGTVRDMLSNYVLGEVQKGSELQMLDPHTRRPVPYAAWPESLALQGELVAGFEGIIVLPSGREFPILAQAGPIFVEGQQVAAIVAFQDISALKEADRAKDQFLMILSHELKTPLTSIIGWVQAARKHPKVTAQAFDIIERNARDQQNILEDLLDVSRILHGRLVIRPEATNLWALALQSVEKFSLIAQERQVVLTTVAPHAPLPVVADPRRLRQVIDNLVDNALKFTPVGGSVCLIGAQEDGQAVIRVQDTGRGIDPADITTLFTPFRQLARSEDAGGLGLGLVLIRGIVAAHHGTVSAESRGVGHGSTFTVALPLAPQEPMRDP